MVVLPFQVSQTPRQHDRIAVLVYDASYAADLVLDGKRIPERIAQPCPGKYVVESLHDWPMLAWGSASALLHEEGRTH